MCAKLDIYVFINAIGTIFGKRKSKKGTFICFIFSNSEQSMMSNIFDSMSTRVLVQNQNIQEHNCDVTRELLLSDHGTYHGLQ